MVATTRERTTYVNADKPAPAVPTTDSLTRLAVLVEVHVEMILQLLLARDVAREPDAALLALTGQVVVQEVGDGRSLSTREQREIQSQKREGRRLT